MPDLQLADIIFQEDEKWNRSFADRGWHPGRALMKIFCRSPFICHREHIFAGRVQTGRAHEQQEFYSHPVEQHLILVAGGIGTRMKSDRPKQFLDLNGTPVIIRTLRAFLEYNQHLNVVICIHRNYRPLLEGILEKAGMSLPNVMITFGGDTRFDSVRNGLKAIGSSTGVVGIHDAARPLVSLQTIRLCYETAAQKGNAVPCVPVNESLRKISNNINVSVNRNEYKVVQTPQCFLLANIRQAFDRSYSPAFTDDASVFEAAGNDIFLVEGNEENLKITSPGDFIIAQALVK